MNPNLTHTSENLQIRKSDILISETITGRQVAIGLNSDRFYNHEIRM